MSNNIFVYGSLINPLSVAGRLSDSNITQEIYDNEIKFDEYYDRTEHINIWNNLKSNGIKLHDVKLDGYKRTYSIKHRGAGMLEVRESNNEWINGVIYENISDELFNMISSTEDGYNVRNLNSNDFDFYGEKTDFNDSIKFYYPEKMNVIRFINMKSTMGTFLKDSYS